MKSKNTLTALCLLALFSFISSDSLMAQDNKKQDWANLGRYTSANETLESPAKKEKRVVFMGNSITEGWVKLRPDFFTENGLIGRGISGQTSSQFLLRFRNDVINLSPSIVVINAGTNDIAENTGAYCEDITFGNIVSMVELAKANKIKVILTSILPAGQFGWNKSITDVPKKISSLNQRIMQYAKQNKIPYVDYYSDMVDRANSCSMIKEYANDGVHPTVEGYKIMESKILKVLKR